MKLNCGMTLPLAREFARKGIRVIPNPNLFDQSTPYPARTILAGDVESAKSPITTDRRKNFDTYPFCRCAPSTQSILPIS